MAENKTSNNSGASRMDAYSALHHEAQRLRTKADLLDKLAKETRGKLSDDAEMMLWTLAHNA